MVYWVGLSGQIYLLSYPLPYSALLGILWMVELQAWSLASTFVRTAATSALTLKALASIAEPVSVNVY